MASLYFAEKNTAWYLPIKLFPQSTSPTEWIASPTIASGDFKRVGYDSSGTVTLASGNLTTTPSTSPASSGWVLLSLSATEMNNDIVCIDWKDASGAEWASGGLTIMTTADNVDDLVTITDAVASVTAGVTLADGAITAAKIASDAITAAKIADGAIDAATFAAGAITASAIAADAITDAKVASDVTIASVTGAVGSVTGAVGSVTAGVSLADGAITAAKIATDAIAAAKVAADAVTKIQTGLATPTNITAGTITTVTNLTNAPTIGDLTATMKASVTAAATAATPTAAAVTAGVTLADGAITAAKIASDAITAASIADGAIDAAAFAAGAITAAVIATGAIDANAIATDAAQKIADTVLGRSVSNIDNTAATHSLYELIQAILGGNTSTGSWVIKKTDGTTTFNTRTLATDPDAVPIVGVS